jgi:hypothetical protein
MCDESSSDMCEVYANFDTEEFLRVYQQAVENGDGIRVKCPFCVEPDGCDAGFVGEEGACLHLLGCGEADMLDWEEPEVDLLMEEMIRLRLLVGDRDDYEIETQVLRSLSTLPFGEIASGLEEFPTDDRNRLANAIFDYHPDTKRISIFDYSWGMGTGNFIFVFAGPDGIKKIREDLRRGRNKMHEIIDSLAPPQ